MSLFHVAALISVLAAVLAVTRAHAVHALLYVVVSFLGIAVVLYQLGAPFVAALEVIVYAGAIVVLFLFVVMLLDLRSDEVATARRLLRPRTWLGPALLSAVLLVELLIVLGADTSGGGTERSIAPREVGAALFGPYALAVEIAALLLLAGLVAASHVGRGDAPRIDREESR